MSRLRTSREVSTNPIKRIIEIYKDIEHMNSILLADYIENEDYSLEHLQKREEHLKLRIETLEYTMEYIESGDTTPPDPPWEQ